MQEETDPVNKRLLYLDMLSNSMGSAKRKNLVGKL